MHHSNFTARPSRFGLLNNEGGFTLLDVLISLSVLSVLAFSLSAYLQGALRTINIMRSKEAERLKIENSLYTPDNCKLLSSEVLLCKMNGQNGAVRIGP